MKTKQELKIEIDDLNTQIETLILQRDSLRCSLAELLTDLRPGDYIRTDPPGMRGGGGGRAAWFITAITTEPISGALSIIGKEIYANGKATLPQYHIRSEGRITKITREEAVRG